jgi:hypothetical protein
MAVLQANAQSNYYKMSVGGGAGLTIGFGDLNYQVISPAVYGAADFYITPFISVGMEGQIGRIKGGDTTENAVRFKNKYKAGMVNVRLAAGAFMNHTYRPNVFKKLARGIYVGTGIGLLRNDITERNPSINFNPRVNQGKRKSFDALLPVNIGLNYGFSEKHGYERFIVNINQQANFTFGEGMDGFDNNPLFVANTHNDIYTFTSIGIKYKFGMVGYFKR